MDEGSIDATTVRLGYTGATGSTGLATGNLNVSGGSFLADSMILAASQGGNNQPVTGNLNVSGTGAVTVTNDLTMGNWGSSSYVGALTANVSITGGSLTVNGNLAEGAGGGASRIISTVTLDGGTLDMTSGTMTNITNFNLQSGTLKNLAQFNAGATVTKSTSGTVAYEGTIAYTGTTNVSEGTLRVNGNLSSSKVTVASGATLAGSGTIGQTITVAAGGNLAPGNSAGLLTTGSISLAGGADLTMEINGTTAGTQHDKLAVTGAVNLNSDSGLGADLVLSLGFAPSTVGQTFNLISNDGADAIAGFFGSINGGAFGPGNTFNLTYNSASYGFQLFYNGEGLSTTGGNDLVLSLIVIPEPGTCALFGIGLCAVLFASRRRRI
jgi:autotransporter-associated beta strand protein